MGRPLYTNNAATYLAFGITNTATTMQVSANAGSLFPNPTGGDYFYVSLISLSGPIIEIVKCTARSGDILTIERGQEGTSPLYSPSTCSIKVINTDFPLAPIPINILNV